MVSTKELFSLKGHTTIVTGGTSGIGRCVADYLASAGANIAIISRHTDAAKTVAKTIAEAYTVASLVNKIREGKYGIVCQHYHTRYL